MDWGYLQEMLAKLGFTSRWINWIMICINSVTYSVSINHDSVGPIFPIRCPRQGDQLSPYLFIICAEGLSALIKREESKGDLHGIKICRNAPIVSHLLFAADSLFFFCANEREVTIMRKILNDHALASRQAINLQKSEVFF